MKRYRKIAAVIAVAALLTQTSFAYAEEDAQTEQKSASVNAATAELSYAYESTAYGYRIMCPKKPVGIIPASTLFENREGEVLIFDNEEYHIKYAWVILVNAFPEKALPNLNTVSPEEAATLLQKIMGSNGYEGIMLINLTDSNKAIFAMTAKEVDIDEDGDGTPDVTATANNQMAVLFFRGENGVRYGVELIDNPELRASSVNTFLAGGRTLHTLQ